MGEREKIIRVIVQTEYVELNHMYDFYGDS